MSFLKKNKNLNRPSNCRVPGVYIKKKKKKHHQHHQNAFHPAYIVSVFYPFPLATRIPTQLPEHAAWGLCFLFRVSP